MSELSDETLNQPLVLEITAAGTRVISGPGADPKPQQGQIDLASLSLAQKLAHAVLLFYAPPPWTQSNQREWEEVTA